MRIVLLVLLLLLVGCNTETAGIELDEPTVPKVIEEKVTEPIVEEQTTEEISGVIEEIIPQQTTAANADVTYVKAVQKGQTWTFYVTVAHLDTGWEDYADGWDVLSNNEVILPNPTKPFTRLLAHPHVNEQPFTRSQSNIIIQGEIVTVRAHDLIDGFGGQEIILNLSKTNGTNYEVAANQK